MNATERQPTILCETPFTFCLAKGLYREETVRIVLLYAKTADRPMLILEMLRNDAMGAPSWQLVPHPQNKALPAVLAKAFSEGLLKSAR